MNGRHIAIVAPPLPGHWDPLQVLARLLIERGHRVTFLHIAASAAMLKDSAFGFEPVGEDSHGPGALSVYRHRLAQAPSLRGFLPMLRATAGMTEMLLRDLPSALQRIGAEAVIGDETEPAAGMAALHLRLPWITSVTGLPLLRDPLVPPPFVGWRFRDDPGGLKRNEGGYRVANRLMRPIRRILEQRARAWGLDLSEIDAGSTLLQVAQCPPALDFPRKGLPASFRYCGPFRLHDDEPVELPTDRPLVYCSLGSLQGNRPSLFRAMTGACADLGARAIVAHGGLLSDAAARALPGNPIVAAYWPQPAILPQCRAALLHGGFNTVLDGLVAGVPMAVRPLAFEQPGTAARIAWTGAGIALGGGLFRRRRMRTALRSLIDEPAFGEAAGKMARHIAQLGGAQLAVHLIEAALTTGGTPPAPA